MRLESGRIFGLDVMRATAISLVLLNHAALIFPATGAFFRIGLLAGYLGVELFFVLSGFLIGGILLRALDRDASSASVSNFWLRRWFRTLPNYFLFLLINIGLALWLGRSTPSLGQYFFFLQNFAARPQPFFLESWSLAIEEWFYLLAPILFFAAIKIAPRKFQASSLIVIGACIGAVTLARTIFVSATHPSWLTGVRIIVIYRLDACMFGVFAAWLKHFYPEIWRHRPLLSFMPGVSLIALVLVLPFVLPSDSLFLHDLGFTLTSLGAMMLLPLLDCWIAADSRSARAVVKISLWSYSLYLINFPVHTILRRFALDASPVLFSTAFLFLSILIAALIYTFYERPIMNLRERFAFRHVRFGLDSVVALIGKKSRA